MYCCSFLSRLGVGMASMSSTLVETVSINYEDFNESFLTCGTCLCTYDGGEHTPKLLPCSHTVCLHCLTRIAASQTRDAGSFRCPICRELITIPRGGVPALPPSFLVNQLLDLMARQRREVIPQCSSHPGRELLFCETCDCVFCRHCADGPHSDTPCDHTVVPFSIALKRMSEILLYRANECLSKLGSAREAVASELRRLEAAATAADEAIDRHFAELRAALDERHNELKSAAAAAATHKRKLLEEQLKLIDAEKSKVEAECSGLQQQVEVREVSSRAAALGARLGDAAALAEPRENAFLAVDFAHNDAHRDFMHALQMLGRVRTSTTFPGLCTLQLESASVCGLEVVVMLRTVDYHGEARCTGGDPVTAAATIDDTPLPCTVTDLDSGMYRISMRPWSSGALCVRVLVFSRAVRDSPLRATVAAAAPALLVWGARGTGKDQLHQPVALARCPKRREIYVLDAGNSRVKVLDDETFAFKTHIVNEGLAGRSCTGIAVTSEGVVAVNWRTRTLTEVSGSGATVRTIRSSRLVEPVCVAAHAASRRLAVADNGARAVFLFDAQGNIEREIGNGELGLVGGLALSEDLLIVADVAVRVYDAEGNLKSTLAPVPKGRGGYGGVALEETEEGRRIVCARSVRGRPALLVLELPAPDPPPKYTPPPSYSTATGARLLNTLRRSYRTLRRMTSARPEPSLADEAAAMPITLSEAVEREALGEAPPPADITLVDETLPPRPALPSHLRPASSSRTSLSLTRDYLRRSFVRKSDSAKSIRSSLRRSFRYGGALSSSHEQLVRGAEPISNTVAMSAVLRHHHAQGSHPHARSRASVI